MTPETLARRFHDTYEELRPETAVPWESVPEGHRELLVRVSERILEELFPPAVPWVDSVDTALIEW
jgi:hypothetical protein